MGIDGENEGPAEKLGRDDADDEAPCVFGGSIFFQQRWCRRSSGRLHFGRSSCRGWLGCRSAVGRSLVAPSAACVAETDAGAAAVLTYGRGGAGPAEHVVYRRPICILEALARGTL